MRSASSFPRMIRKFCSSGRENACHCWEKAHIWGELLTLFLSYQCKHRIYLQITNVCVCVYFITSTSPVSFSFRTKLSCSGSGPAINLRRRGRSLRESFWNRSETEEKGPASKWTIQRCLLCLCFFFFYELVTRCVCLTLPVPVRLSAQSEFAGIVQHHELFQQALDDFSGGGQRADVEPLHTVARHVEGRSLVTLPIIVAFLAFWWRHRLIAPVRLPQPSLQTPHLHSGDCDWSTEPQVDLNVTCVGSVWSLAQRDKRPHSEMSDISVFICAL